MTIFANYPSVMPTVSLEAVISNNPKIQTIKRAQDLPNIEEFRVQHKNSIPSAKEILLRFKFTIGGEEGKALRGYLEGVNFVALAYACMVATGKDEVPEFSLSNLGGFNAIFRASFRGDEDLIIRIPLIHTPGVMASTVATMSYARYLLAVPCPAVLAWNDQKENPVEKPYVIMTAARGASLYDCFLTPDKWKQIRVCMELNYQYSRLFEEQPFQEYGRLVFNDKHPEASLGDLSSYCISALFYNKPSKANVTYVALNLEPSKDIRTMWTEAWDANRKQLIERWGKNGKKPDDTIQEDNWMIRAAIRAAVGNAEPPWGLVEDAIANLLHLIENIPIPPELLKPCLVWPDYAFRNIMYDESDNEITSFLDWDDAAILPAILIPHLPEDIYQDVMPGKITEEYSNKDVQKNIEQGLRGEYPRTFDRSLEYYRGLDAGTRSREFDTKTNVINIAKEDVEAVHERTLMTRDLAHLCELARDHLQVSESEVPVWADRLECKDAMRVHRLLQMGYSEWIVQSGWLKKKAMDSKPPRPQLYSTRRNMGVRELVAFSLGLLLISVLHALNREMVGWNIL